MADLSSRDRMLLALLHGPISSWARPHVLPAELRQRYTDRGRPIVYVLDTHGIADLVVLDKVCRAHGLPQPLQDLRPPLPAQSVFFLERFAGFWGSRIDRRVSHTLRHLVVAVAADPSLDVDLIPVSVLWGRAPDRDGSWLRMMLSESWDRVGRFRRLLSVLVNGRNLFVQFGEPISLRGLLEEGSDTARAVRRSARSLRAARSRRRGAVA